MPLFFASNAVYPIAIMPDWLKLIARANPLTYEVDALRSLMVIGGTSMFGPQGAAYDLLLLLAATILMTCIGALLYPRLAV
jgi:ABC-2 type transport system permease protein